MGRNSPGARAPCKGQLRMLYQKMCRYRLDNSLWAVPVLGIGFGFGCSGGAYQFAGINGFEGGIKNAINKAA